MKKLFALVVLSLLPRALPAASAPVVYAPPIYCSGSLNCLNSVAANAAPGTRTVTVPLNGNYSKLRLEVTFDWTAATNVRFTSYCTKNGSGYVQMTTKACSLGVCTHYNRFDDFATTADATWEIEYDVAGCQSFKTIYSTTGGGANDKVTVQLAPAVGM